MDKERRRDILAVHSRNCAANVGMSILRLLRGRDFPRADGPDGFIRDHDVLHLLGGDARKAADELRIQHTFGLCRLAFGEQLADTEDDFQPRRECRVGLLVEERIGFAEAVASLAVADNRVLATDFEEHLRRRFAGVRAFFFEVAILRAEQNARAF